MNFIKSKFIQNYLRSRKTFNPNFLKVKRIGDHKLPLPSQQHKNDAGFDLSSTIDIELSPNYQKMIPCGFAFEIPYGCVGLIKERSSISLKMIYVSAGVIDSSYRGEVKILIRSESILQKICIGDRIAQLIILPYLSAKCIEVDSLNTTSRNESGFGSTNIIKGKTND